MKMLARLSMPLCLCLWELAVRVFHVPPYLLPGPIAIVEAFVNDWRGLVAALGVTLAVMLVALLVSIVVLIHPWAVVLQVTPVVAIAPLVIIWIGNPFIALVMCASIVAFFPIFSATSSGLAAPPPELLDLFHLNGAKIWQEIFWLRLPAALPLFLSGLRISGGLALVGAVVAEFVNSTGGGATGLATRLLESSYRLEIPRMFACLALLALTGFGINFALGKLESALLRRFGSIT
jgi:NitT/TauT family transport system permease protein